MGLCPHLGQSLELYFLEWQLHLLVKKSCFVVEWKLKMPCQLILHLPPSSTPNGLTLCLKLSLQQSYIVIKVVDSVSALQRQFCQQRLHKKGLCSTVGRVGTARQGKVPDPFTSCGPVGIWKKRWDLGIFPPLPSLFFSSHSQFLDSMNQLFARDTLKFSCTGLQIIFSKTVYISVIRGKKKTVLLSGLFLSWDLTLSWGAVNSFLSLIVPRRVNRLYL